MTTITLYSKPACPQCTATKKKLGKLGIEYIEIDAREHVDELKAAGHLGAPVVVVSNEGGVVEAWSGYRPDRLTPYVATPAVL